MPNFHPRILLWSGAALLLLLPALAMQVTDEVNWGPGDFGIFAAMIGSTGLALEWVARKTGNHAYRGAMAIALATAFLLAWINLAVGIIGSEDNRANLMFASVIGVAATGAMIARFASRGMVRAMVATAVAQAIVGAIALSNGFFLLPVTAGFVALWLLSARLFRSASRREHHLA